MSTTDHLHRTEQAIFCTIKIGLVCSRPTDWQITASTTQYVIGPELKVPGHTFFLKVRYSWHLLSICCFPAYICIWLIRQTLVLMTFNSKKMHLVIGSERKPTYQTYSLVHVIPRLGTYLFTEITSCLKAPHLNQDESAKTLLVISVQHF